MNNFEFERCMYIQFMSALGVHHKLLTAQTRASKEAKEIKPQKTK